MKVSSSICFWNTAESHFRGGQRSCLKWSNILDCIRRQDSRNAVCASPLDDYDGPYQSWGPSHSSPINSWMEVVCFQWSQVPCSYGGTALGGPGQTIHRICLALGFKSAIFHTQVRTANSQQKKTCAWNAVKSVDTTVHEHACIYSLACNAYQVVQKALSNGLNLPQLVPHDLYVATLVLGSDKVGQCNKQ